MSNYIKSFLEEGGSFNKKKVTLSVLLLALIVVVMLFFFINKNNEKGSSKKPADFRSSLEKSVGGVDPKPLQNFFVEKVKNKQNDQEAKSAIYWIIHRYFDNGGDIYEIYDFIQANPEVSFLNEAEKIYPESFSKIKTSKVKNWSSESLLALVAYYEVIDKHGYADISMWGLAANKYSEFAYGAKEKFLLEGNKRSTKGGMSTLQFKSMTTEKARYFSSKVEDFITKNTQKTKSLDDLRSLPIIPDDLLVGLNQYGSALENLKGIGFYSSKNITPKELYDFNYSLASTLVPRLYFFTNYLYATSLVYGGDATKTSVKLPLSRAVDYAEKTDPSKWSKSVTRVINSKTSNERSMYEYSVVKKLAALDPKFKAWLKKYGWTEADFK